MANRQQLKILRSGIESWNHWRKENPDAVINLRGANFHGESLKKANLSSADIRGANFSNADLEGANFTHAKAGLQRQWSILLLLLSFIGLQISKVCNFFLAFSAAYIFSGNPSDAAAGCLNLSLVVALYLLLLRRGFGALMLAGFVAALATTIVFVVTIIGGVLFLILSNPSITISNLLTTLDEGFFAFQLSATIAITGFTTISLIIIGAFAGAYSAAVAMASGGVFGLVVMLVGLVTDVLGWQSPNGNLENNFVFTVMLGCSCLAIYIGLFP